MRSGFLARFTLFVLPLVAFGNGGLPPVIVQQPVSVTAYLGDSATLTAVVDGTAPITLQWRKNNVSIGGATAATLTLTSVTAADQGVYDLLASNAHGTAQTLPVAIFVSKRPQTITFAPAVTTLPAGSGVVLSATATSGLTVTFSLVSGAASLSGNSLTGNGGNVIVRASQAGNATFAAAESVEQSFAFVSGSLTPFITSPPLDQMVTAGTSVTFRGTAIGTPAPTYQWQKDGVALPGETTPVLTLSTTTLADSGRFTLLATNPSGTASASATLTVRAAPVIVAPPADLTVFAGDRATFAVNVTGFPAPAFQWRKNGTAISGATSATFALASAQAADAASYDVVVTNTLGSATSAAATLTVNTRDFSGTYLGRFAGTTGDFALLVRADRTGVFLGHLPGLQRAIAVTNLRVELSGNFTASTVTLGATAATQQTVTLRGTVNDSTGEVSGTLAELGVTFSALRSTASPAGTASGFYQAALIGSTSGRGSLVIAPDGEALLLTTAGATLDAARGRIDANGRLIVTTGTQANVDLGFANGVVSGSVRPATGPAGSILGTLDSLARQEHLANLSIRTVTSPGAATLITGFVVTGTTAKQVLIRAAGPTLAGAPFNVPNVLADPTVQVLRGQTTVGQNDDWGTPAANATAVTAAATRVGAFPFRAGSNDAALVTTLTPGPYSVVIAGGTGTVLAEVYEVLQANEAPGTRRLANLSARGLVSPNAPFITGFVISGPGPQRVLIRGIGPTLGTAPFNVAGALPNPQLTLFRGSATLRANDDWFRDPEAAAIRDVSARSGAFALGAASLDAAILLYLEPGAYTAQINPPANANAANSTGLVLIEVYEAAP